MLLEIQNPTIRLTMLRANKKPKLSNLFLLGKAVALSLSLCGPHSASNSKMFSKHVRCQLQKNNTCTMIIVDDSTVKGMPLQFLCVALFRVRGVLPKSSCLGEPKCPAASLDKVRSHLEARTSFHRSKARFGCLRCPQVPGSLWWWHSQTRPSDSDSDKTISDTFWL